MGKIAINKVKEFLLERDRRMDSLKKNERREIIEDLKELEYVWEKYGLEKVYLYGSFADMTFYNESDVDIAIEPEIHFETLLKLYSEVNKKIKREVDIRFLKELPFAKKIKRIAVLIYERKNIYS